MAQKLNLNLTVEHIVQIVVGLAGLVSLYVALNVRISVLEIQIAEEARHHDERYQTIQRQFDSFDDRLSEINEQIREVDSHIDVVDGHIYEHVLSHNE